MLLPSGRGLASLALACFLALPFAQGCGSSSDDASTVQTGDEDDVIPEAAKTLFDQAQVCSEILKRHEVVRSVDLKDGSIRWNCGDVPGVTTLDVKACQDAQADLRAKKKAGTAKPADADNVNRLCQGFGQEYCEYAAISGGKIVSKLADVAPNAPIQCLFTSVFTDAFPDQGAQAAKLGQALASKENVGVAVDPTAVAMQVGFNSRGAATALITDCHDNSSDGYQSGSNQSAIKKALLDESRQAACWLAATADPAKQTKLRAACRGRDLSVESRWAKVTALGVDVAKVGAPTYEKERDLAACLAAKRSGGVTWRNSDNMICARVTRAAGECSCGYAPLPEASAGFVGFSFTGWTNDQLPAGCRYAKIDSGKGPAPYKNLVICELSATERSDLEVDDTYTVDLQALCHDKFSREIVMQAPIRAVEKAGSCKTDAAFCKSYEGQ